MPFDSRERRVQLPRGWPKTTGMGGRKLPEWVAENHQNRHVRGRDSDLARRANARDQGTNERPELC